MNECDGLRFPRIPASYIPAMPMSRHAHGRINVHQCGHSACQRCYARMLVAVNAEPNTHVKKLECPECRVVMDVPRGRAANLPKNFALLR